MLLNSVASSYWCPELVRTLVSLLWTRDLLLWGERKSFWRGNSLSERVLCNVLLVSIFWRMLGSFIWRKAYVFIFLIEHHRLLSRCHVKHFIFPDASKLRERRDPYFHNLWIPRRRKRSIYMRSLHQLMSQFGLFFFARRWREEGGAQYNHAINSLHLQSHSRLKEFCLSLFANRESEPGDENQ